MIRVLHTRSGDGADSLSGRSSAGEAVAGSASERALGKRFALSERTELQLGLDRVRGGFMT